GTDQHTAPPQHHNIHTLLLAWQHFALIRHPTIHDLSRDLAIMAPVPIVYKAFFLWIEPFFTLLGAIYAFFLPQTYLDMTRATQSTDTIGSSVATLVA